MTASGSGKAYVSVNKALVTQASSAIPVVPLYVSILYKIMQEMGTHRRDMGRYGLYLRQNDWPRELPQTFKTFHIFAQSLNINKQHKK